jgi:hypothetical protein
MLICLPASLRGCVSESKHICQPAYQPVSQPYYMSAYLPACLIVCLFVCLSRELLLRLTSSLRKLFHKKSVLKAAELN